MQVAISETNRRREIQIEFNKKHNITPKTIVKKIENTLQITKQAKEQKIKREEIPKEIETLKGLMASAAARLDFETAIEIRNQIAELKKQLK